MNSRHGIKWLSGLAVLALVAVPMLGLAHQVAAHSDHHSSPDHPCDICQHLDGNPSISVDAGLPIVQVSRSLVAPALAEDLEPLPAIVPNGRAPPGISWIS